MDRSREGPRCITVGELAERYLAHAKVYYRRSDGRPTREHCNIGTIVHEFVSVAGEHLQAHAVNRHDLTHTRTQLLKRECKRVYINQSMLRLRRMFRWALTEELLPNDDALRILGAFAAIGPLTRNRSEAKESERKRVIDLASVRLAMPYIKSDAARDVLTILMCSGARVGEVLCLRSCDLEDDDGNLWAMPKYHKTAHHGTRRFIPIVGNAIEVVMRRQSLYDAYLFPGTRTNSHATWSMVETAMRRGFALAEEAGVTLERFTLHDIRHAVATKARRAGIELDGIQAMLGHSSRRMTEQLDYPALAHATARRLQEVL